MTEPLLRIRDLHAWYGDSHALHGVDFDVSEGETITLIGRNGAGKTTILRAIVGLIKRRTGRILLNGANLMDMPVHRIATTGLGYVPEERGIFASLSVEENLLLPPSLGRTGVSLDEIFEMFPNLKERRNSPGTKLSGGEQQMLAIARVLRSGARFLLLDEPTEGLAPVIVQRIAAVLADFKQRGYTILLVEQNFRFAAGLSDQMFVVEHGRIVDQMAGSDAEARKADLAMYLGV